MKYKNVFRTLLLAITLTGALHSCYFDNEETLYPGDGSCDTSNVTYSSTVAVIMGEKCNSCHGGTFPEAGQKTDNYNDLKSLADNGKLWGTINHESGYPAMPKGKPKLRDCELRKIRIWLDNGAPND